MTKFKELGIDEVLLRSLDRLKFEHPTDIQEKAIPIALEGRDIIGSAQTGTGKTLAFLLPMISGLLNNKESKAIIVEPTRELAQQVSNGVRQLLGNEIFIRHVLLIGGESFIPQLRALRHNPRLIIGTPGRIIDHLQRESLDLSECKYLVLDETDRMFDMGFYMQLEKIFNAIPGDRQTLMFSATFPPEVERLAIEHMHNPERVFVQADQQANAVADNLIQETVEVFEKDKYKELVNQLNKREGTVLVFVKTKFDAEHICSKLYRDGFSVCVIHGDLRQRVRERTIRDFRGGRYKIMVGTDVVARGLDVPHVAHVINYSIPYAPEDYIHRIGRTARAGASGCAVSFVSEEDSKAWRAIQEMLHPELKKERIGAVRRRFGKPDFHRDRHRFSNRNRGTRRFGRDRIYSDFHRSDFHCSNDNGV